MEQKLESWREKYKAKEEECQAQVYENERLINSMVEKSELDRAKADLVFYKVEIRIKQNQCTAYVMQIERLNETIQQTHQMVAREFNAIMQKFDDLDVKQN
jgi:uncharacterized membrane protein YqiK